jgi:hypothetical protein
MKKSIIIVLGFIFIGVVFNSAAVAAEAMQILQSVRSAAMGGVAVATADKDNMLYANPAFLSQVDRFHMTILGIQAGVGEDTITKLQEVQSAAGKSGTQAQSDAMTALVPSLLTGSVAPNPMITSFVTKDLGFGTYSNLKFSAEILNKNSPTFRVKALGDAAVVLAKSFELNPFLVVAPALRYIYRGGVYDSTDGDNQIDLGYVDAFNLMQNKGNTQISFYQAGGLAFDVGALAYVGPGQLGVSWQNISGTLSGQLTTQTATTDASIKTRTSAYSGTMPTVITLGYASDILSLFPLNPFNLLSDTTVALDWRVSSPEQLVYKNIRAGIEKDLWGGILQLRGGINEGYSTYGLGINLGIIDIDYASYLEEGSKILGLQPLATQLVSVAIGF